MTATLHFSSSSDKSVHVAKLTLGDTVLFRVMFVGHVLHRMKRAPTPDCRELSESEQFSLVSKCVEFARDLAKKQTPASQLRACTVCVSSRPVPASSRIFCELWKVGCNQWSTCHKFERAAPLLEPPQIPSLRQLVPGEQPIKGDLYPDLDGKLVPYKGLAPTWHGLASRHEWRTTRPTPATTKHE